MIITIIIAILAFGAGLLLTLTIERNAQRLGLLRAPNAHASHVRPIPRGGGLAIAMVTVVAALAWPDASHALWPFAGLLAVVAALGLIDDRSDLSPALRFLVQAVVLAVLIWSAGPLPVFNLFEGQHLAGLALAAVVVLAGVWWLNLFNFMDGSDGLAATQAILVLAGRVLIPMHPTLQSLANPHTAITIIAIAATAGFLVRNWPPARIFMGDVGSYSLGFIVFAMLVLAVKSGQLTYQSCLVLPATFVSDATVTLVRRVANGERPWRGHRRHAYQQLSRTLGKLPVLLIYGAVTILWCWPLAWAAAAPDRPWWPVLAAYLPLVIAAVWAGAGERLERPARERGLA